MSAWNHRCCGECWIVDKVQEMEALPSSAWAENLRLFIPRPAMLTQVKPGFCCLCGQPTRLGIYVRRDPKGLACVHPDEGTE